MGKVLRLVILALFVTMSTNVAAAQSLQDGDFEGLVDVGGYRLFIRCMGEGSPTVILEAALGSTSDTWREIQPEVATFTRVCVYDRAGLGLSDPAPTPRTPQDMVDDLRTLLHNAGVPGPYVLVGHSFGGWIAQLFARQDGGISVVGVVLVDATPAQWVQVGDELGLPLPTLGLNPEGADLRASAAQLLSAPPFPDIPLIVLARTVFPPSPPGSVGEQLTQRWNELQAAQAELSPQGELIFVEGARHFIHRDRPDVTIESIRRVVEAARAQTRPGKGCGDTNHFHERKVECKKAARAA